LIPSGLLSTAQAPLVLAPHALAPLAHGVGSRDDLPLPLEWAVAGAAFAVLVSFVALALLWREPHIHGGTAGRPLSPGAARFAGSRGLRLTLRIVGVAATLYVLIPLVLGQDDARNPVPWVVYVLLWVGMVPLSVIFGPVWRWLNPVRTLHLAINRAAGLDPRLGVRPLPARMGYWPAAAGLFAFTWIELVYPDNATLVTLRVAIVLYVLVQLTFAFLYGSHWFDRGDPFEAWSGLFGRFSVVGRRDDGVWVLRSPLAGLDALRPAPGLAATAVVMLGSTAYDSFGSSTLWVGWAQAQAAPRLMLDTAAMLAVILTMGLVFAVCTGAAGRLAGLGRAGMPGAFAPSVIPVALGYVVAHYYSFLALEGQRAFIKLSDPLGTGANWLGLSHAEPVTGLINPTLVANLQVLAIVAGHIVGVVLAHERAITLFPRRVALIGQVPLLALMVALTCTGLLLLFAS
jgi:hypothetical protein